MIGGSKGAGRKRMHRISQLLEAVPPIPKDSAEERTEEDQARLRRISDLIDEELQQPELSFETAPISFVEEEPTDEDFISFDDVTREIENALPPGLDWLGSEEELTRRRHETPPEGIRLTMARAMLLTEGMFLHGYMMGELAGIGSEAVVQYAVNSLTRQTSVVKFPHTRDDDKTSDMVKWIFKNEAETLKQLDHPNIVKLIDYKETKGRPYIFLEPLKGMLLDAYEKDRSLETLARIMVQASSAVENMHEQGLVYLDMKPTQFMTDNDGNVKLIDFGSTRPHMAEIKEDEPVQLTPGYLIRPPEIDGKYRWHRAMDMYTLGKTFGAFALLSTGATWDEAQSIVKHNSEGVYINGLNSRLHEAWGKKLARYFMNNITLKSLRPLNGKEYEFTITEMRKNTEKFRRLVERKDQSLLDRLKFW